MDVIEKIIVRYLLSYNTPGKVFFASLLTQMQKQPNSNIPTLGVTIIDGQLYLMYNPDFIDALIQKKGIEKLKGVLEHELLHVAYDHLSRCVEFSRVPRTYNIATDMTINQMIDKKIMPDKIIMRDPKTNKWVDADLIWPEGFGLPKDKGSEWYYNALSQKEGQGKGKNGLGKGKNGLGKGELLDNHELWDKIKGNKQMIKEVVKRAVKEAYDNSKKLKGSLPSELEEKIQELLKPPTVNWKTLLRQYIGASIKTGWKSSWKRPCRRMPDREDIKGKTAKRTIKILVGIDTSGSIDTKDFEDFLGEMKGIMNAYKCKIDTVVYDASLHLPIQTLKPYNTLKVKFKGRGGTDYKPLFDFLKEHIKYDLMINFTDLYCNFAGCKPYNRNIIWVTTNDYDKDNTPPFGKTVHIKREKR